MQVNVQHPTWDIQRPTVGRQLFLLAFVVVLLCVGAARAADWQWSVDVPGPKSDENGRQPTAFLWVPPDCQRVRAVIIGQHNMEEEPILEHPAFRKAMA